MDSTLKSNSTNRQKNFLVLKYTYSHPISCFLISLFHLCKYGGRLVIRFFQDRVHAWLSVCLAFLWLFCFVLFRIVSDLNWEKSRERSRDFPHFHIYILPSRNMCTCSLSTFCIRVLIFYTWRSIISPLQTQHQTHGSHQGSLLVLCIPWVCASAEWCVSIIIVLHKVVSLPPKTLCGPPSTCFFPGRHDLFIKLNSYMPVEDS